WAAEDDEILLSLITSGNWSYIAETINTMRATVSGFKRTPYECYDRWKSIDDISKYIILDNDASSSDSEEISSVLGTSGAGTSAGTSSSSLTSGNKIRRELQRKDSKNKIPKFDPAKSRRQANLAEAIKKSAKKREEAIRRPHIAQSKKTAETAASSTRTPTPLELSRLKLDQDRVQQQVIQEQRQAAALAMQGRQSSTIPRPSLQGVSHIPGQLSQSVTRPVAANTVTSANQLHALMLQRHAQQVLSQRAPQQQYSQMTPAITQVTQAHPQQIMAVQNPQFYPFYNRVQARATQLLQGAQAFMCF
ncbi:6129_t:CDS:2, partial [Paraglomus brasilianum]